MLRGSRRVACCKDDAIAARAEIADALSAASASSSCWRTRICTFRPTPSPTTATGSPRRAGRGASTRASSSRSRPRGQVGSHDAAETVHDVWITPREALERGGAQRDRARSGDASSTLQDLKKLQDRARGVRRGARAPEPEVQPRLLGAGHDGAKLFRRADPAVFRDPLERPARKPARRATTSRPGVPKRLDRYVTRIIAPNPGVMTGPGTNTYLVGERRSGSDRSRPAIASHVERIVDEAKGRIRWILCTHTHLDHSPAAAALKAATGAQVLGRPAPDQGQDATFKPDFVLENGQRVDLERAQSACARSTRRATPRTTSATCSSRRKCSSPATT